MVMMTKLRFLTTFSFFLMIGYDYISMALAADVDARFCDSCVSETAAKAKAAQYVLPLECTNSAGINYFGPDMTCTSRRIPIVLVHPQTDAVFSFVVGHNPNPPWSVQVQPQQLSQDAVAGLKQASKINREFRASLVSINANNFYDPTITYSLSSANTSNHATKTTTINTSRMLSGECPIDTALASLTDAQFLQKAAIRARIALQYEWEEIKNEKGFLSAFGIGLQFRGVGIDIQFDGDNGRPLVLREEYTSSEVNPIFNDVLIYNLTVVSEGTTGVRDITLSLNSASQVAGLNLSAVSASAFTDIDNECAKQRIEEWVENNPSVTIAPGGGGSTFPIPGPGTNPGGGPSGGCQIVSFQQHGNNPQRYVFRICR